MGQHVALYLRISRDKSGRVEGVGRQEKWGRAYAERMWPDLPVRVFPDNDVSAFDDDVKRPGYDDLRAAVRAGEVAHIWCVEQTRLEANRLRWVELVAELDDAGLTEIHTDRDGVVRLDEVADIKHILAWHERKRLRERVRDTLGDLADEGRPGGGNCFGLVHVREEGKPGRYEHDPKRAPALRWAADAVLSGWSLSAVARELEVRKVPTLHGGKWSHGNVRGMLTAPTAAGLRVHGGQVVRDGNWEPVIEPAVWRQLDVLLNQKRKVVRPDGTIQLVTRRRMPARRYLLTGGLAVCGRCDAALVGRRRTNSRGVREPIYFCDTGHGGCGRLGVNADPFERRVVDRLLVTLADDESFRAQLTVDTHGQRRDTLVRQLADIDHRQVVLAERWAAGRLSDAAWDAARAKLDDDKRAYMAELATIPSPVTDIDPDAVVAGWEEMTLGERRHVLGLFIVRVVVNPATPGIRHFDPGRMTGHRFDGEIL